MDILNQSDEYSIIALLGKGSYGTIYKVTILLSIHPNRSSPKSLNQY